MCILFKIFFQFNELHEMKNIFKKCLFQSLIKYFFADILRKNEGIHFKLHL